MAVPSGSAAEEVRLACSDKLSFDTAAAARTAAAVARYQHGVALSVYRCHDCGLWHLSSSSADDAE